MGDSIRFPPTAELEASVVEIVPDVSESGIPVLRHAKVVGFLIAERSVCPRKCARLNPVPLMPPEIPPGGGLLEAGGGIMSVNLI